MGNFEPSNWIQLIQNSAKLRVTALGTLRPTSGTFMPGLVWLASLDTVNHSIWISELSDLKWLKWSPKPEFFFLLPAQLEQWLSPLHLELSWPLQDAATISCKAKIWSTSEIYLLWLLTKVSNARHLSNSLRISNLYWNHVEYKLYSYL